MSGWLTNGMNQLSSFTGNEQLPLDTTLLQGIVPQNGMSDIVTLATAFKRLNQTGSGTMVAGSRYYTGITFGFSTLVTGLEVLVGGTGGSDLWILELHDSTGALVATTTISGTTAGTANTFQRIALTTPYTAAAGQYYIALQSNGTTATRGTYNSAGLPLLVGSATGTFATGAAITPPTTYTASIGPMVSIY